MSITNNSHEYREHIFLVEALLDGGLWKGRFRLLGDPSAVPPDHARKFTWVPLDEGWATQDEAQMNAQEAAHSAIDALHGLPARIEG